MMLVLFDSFSENGDGARHHRSKTFCDAIILSFLMRSKNISKNPFQRESPCRKGRGFAESIDPESHSFIRGPDANGGGKLGDTVARRHGRAIWRERSSDIRVALQHGHAHSRVGGANVKIALDLLGGVARVRGKGKKERLCPLGGFCD